MKLFAILAALCTSVVGVALNPESESVVTIDFSSSKDCTGPSQSVNVTFSAGCVLIPPGSKGLLITGVTNAENIPYNSLRVHKDENCAGFGDIEQVAGCPDNVHGCFCSSASYYKSVRLTLD